MINKKLHATIVRHNPPNYFHKSVQATFCVGMDKSLADNDSEIWTRKRLLGELMSKDWYASDMRSITTIAWLFTAYIHKIPEMVTELYKDDNDVYLIAEVVHKGKNKWTWAYRFVDEKFFKQFYKEVHNDGTSY